MKVKALGQTVEHGDKVQLVLTAKDYPANCMVLFIDMGTWHEIKDDVEVEE